MSGFLLDTNILSELVRMAPDPKVAKWMADQDLALLFVSVVSFGELRRGVAMLESGKKKAQLESWLAFELPPMFSGRILPITQAIAERWGEMEAQRQLVGRPLNVPDAQIAATADLHGLTMVTRNVKDFDGLGLTILNPWV